MLENGTVTNHSGGTISGGDIGVIILDDGLGGGGSNAVVSNDGTITGGAIGVRFGSIGGIAGGFGELTNSFLIEATGTDGVGASFKLSGVVTNSGRIEAAATGGIAIQAGDTVTVNNLSSGVITGDRRAIEAATANVNNDNLIEATAASGAIAIQASDTVTVNNSASGVIRASGVLGTAITASTVNVTANAGTISGGTTGINAFTVNVTSNAGTISGGEFGIFAEHRQCDQQHRHDLRWLDRHQSGQC